MTKKIWLSKPPAECDICGKKIENEFIDAKTTLRGTWAILCQDCFKHGPGLNALGPGLGQRYVKNEFGDFEKVEG